MVVISRFSPTYFQEENKEVSQLGLLADEKYKTDYKRWTEIGIESALRRPNQTTYRSIPLNMSGSFPIIAGINVPYEGNVAQASHMF